MLLSNRAVAALLVVLGAGVAASYIHLPLPIEEQGLRQVSGQIASCDIKKLRFGRFGSGHVFVGITLGKATAPYLRADVEPKQEAFFKKLCDVRAHVTVAYRAQRILLRPALTYWVESISSFNAKAGKAMSRKVRKITWYDNPAFADRFRCEVRS